MIRNWIQKIARWCGARAPGAPATPAPPAASTASPPRAGRASPAGPARPGEVDAVFYRWISGAGEYDAPPGTEQLIEAELVRLADAPGAGADLVPRVPEVVPQLLRSLRDDGVSGAQLARQLSQDVVLVAEVIREVNSPWYHPAAPVRNIEGALMLLGQNGLRMLIARVAFRPIINMQSGPLARHAAPLVWRHAEKCAMAASLLAPALKANPFEAYLAALMHNVGLIVALRLIDRMVPEHAAPQSDAFCAALFARARTLSSRIAAVWEFPVTVSAAVAQAALPNAPALARTLAQADRLAKLRMLVDGGQFAHDDPFVLDGMDQAARAAFEAIKDEKIEDEED